MAQYRESGVDLDFAERIPGIIKALMKAKGGGIGGFSAVYPMGKNNYISLSCDGVGTKVLLAEKLGKFDTVGIDLVAMNVDDVLCSGIPPRYFLDYIGFGNMPEHHFKDILKGVIEGCRQAGCELSGGETAQMPILYGKSFDLAGFAVGIGTIKDLFPVNTIIKGDLICGFPSSGIHSNGYSLVNKLIKEKKLHLSEELLTPTRIYAKKIARAREKCSIKGAAHITGGGLVSNIKRIIPKGLGIKLYYDWTVPEIFKRIQACGVSKDEMFSVFNMGIGFTVVCSRKEAEKLPKETKIIGEII